PATSCRGQCDPPSRRSFSAAEISAGRVCQASRARSSLTPGAAVQAGAAVPTLEGTDMDTERQWVEAWERGQRLGTVAVVEQDGVLMEVHLAAAWCAMRDAAAADGVTLAPTSGFRTMDEQRQLWEEHVSGQRPTPVAKPGFSNHQSGRALDITVHDCTTSD